MKCPLIYFIVFVIFALVPISANIQSKKGFMPFRNIGHSLGIASGLASPLCLNPLESLAGTPIPVSTRSDDSVVETVKVMKASPHVVMPNVEVASLDGAGNLGSLLWAYVLYTGVISTIISPRSGRPADWILPLVVKVTQEEQSEWFLNYEENLRFDVPPLAELVRVLFFLSLGFYTNILVVSALDGDAFWGWSIAGSLAIPALLIDAARPKPPTREEMVLRMELEADFSGFLARRIRESPGSKTQEEALLRAFRREFAKYRGPASPPDALLIKVVRQRLGCKPDNLGYYLNLVVESRTAGARKSREATISRLNEERKRLRSLALSERSGDGANMGSAQGESGDEEGWGSSGFDNEFVRRV